MKPGLNPYQVVPDAMKPVAALDKNYERARRSFSEEELVKLTVAVATINGWNRIAIGFRAVHPARQAHAG
jgi:alkylhydroperoxidase family enzyme